MHPPHPPALICLGLDRDPAENSVLTARRQVHRIWRHRSKYFQYSPLESKVLWIRLPARAEGSVPSKIWMYTRNGAARDLAQVPEDLGPSAEGFARVGAPFLREVVILLDLDPELSGLGSLEEALFVEDTSDLLRFNKLTLTLIEECGVAHARCPPLRSRPGLRPG
jgi:hypothetical protein